jgi:hypothetical protein
MSRYTPLPSSQPSSLRPSSPLDLLNDQEAATLLSDPVSSKFRRAPKERGRVAAKDYPKDKKSLILAATRVYYVKIWTLDPFPDDKLQVRWAIDAWNAVADGLPLPDDGVIQYVSIFVTPAEPMPLMSVA